MVFSFTYQTYPTQCQNLTINWTGGSAPYHILLVPIGDAETVTKKPENRKIVDVVINDASQSSYTFKLQFPGGTQFVPTIYDKNGIQAGATGVPTTVAAADDASCLFGPTKTKFDFYLTPGNILTQCASTKITWTGSPTPPLTFYGLIPGGESFQIPVPSGATTEFDWTANVRQGSSVLIVAGDSTGIGLGGSALFNVNSGGTSCLNNNSPSSTLGSPAGAVTGTPGGGNGGSAGGGSTGGGSSTGGGGSSSKNIGPIIGGVVGGVVGLLVLLLVALFFYRRRKFHKKQAQHQDVDLLQETPPEDSDPANRSTLNHTNVGTTSSAREAGWYLPAIAGTADTESNRLPSQDGRPSMSTAGPLSSASTPSLHRGAGTVTSEGTSVPTSAGFTNSSRKTGAPATMRPVNFIVHDDGGAVDPPTVATSSQEVVELPPTYNEASGAPNRS